MSSKRHQKLRRDFYSRPTQQVARDLLGKFLVYRSPEGTISGKLVEVEAYIGQTDPACHAARGKTARNAVMFGPPGVAYIYFVYGMYHCLNFVTEQTGFPAAVLIRAAEPADGVEVMRRLSPGRNGYDLLNGPGKICRSFGLTRAQNGLDLTGERLYVEDRNVLVARVGRSPRVGVKVGSERPWRFYDRDSGAVSRL
ncbi:MAG TPA: DNA-3-methyladenine glycosylase, partial [Candidatus Deferrimicrobium sp.]|nr:DNA-3-methyladenine glycosylase [Candidatus Deferrimicrobium sp.]